MRLTKMATNSGAFDSVVDTMIAGSSLKDGLLYVGLDKLYAVNVASNSLASSSWPATFGDNRASRRVPFDGVARRAVHIEGRVQHPHRAEAFLSDYIVEVHTDTGELLCKTVSDVEGRYVCGSQTERMESFDLTFNFSSDKAAGTGTATLPAGAAGDTTVLTQNLIPELTTLHLHGVVSDAGGVGLSGVAVTAHAGGALPDTTDTSGNYDLYLDFPTDTSTAEVPLGWNDGTNILNRTTSVELQAGALTEHAYSVTFSAGDGYVEWSQPVSAEHIALAADGTLYTAYDYSDVRALNADGLEKWRFYSNYTYRLAVAADNTLYVGSYNKLYAVRADGSLKWSASAQGSVSTLALAEDGTLYAGDSESLRAFTPEGTPLWTFEMSSRVKNLAVGGDGTVYSTTGSLLYALSADGKEIWSFHTDNSIEALAVGRNRTVYVASSTSHWKASGGWLYALNPDGTALWSLSIGERSDSLALGEDGTIYIGAINAVIAVDSSGGQKWRMLTEDAYGGAATTTLAIGSNGTIYAGVNKTVYALSTGGEERWRFVTERYIDALSLEPNGVLYVGSSYHLHAVDTDSAGLASSPWPKEHGNNQTTGRVTP